MVDDDCGWWLMETWHKVVAVVGVLALAGGAGRHAEDAQKDPNQVYGPTELGDDVGRGLDRVGGAVGDAAGSAVGGSDLAKGAAIGAGAYGAAKAGKAWRNRAKEDPGHVDVPPVQPTLPPVQPVPGVAD